MCIEKLDNTCIRSYARCVMYDGTIPAFSELTGNTCVTVEEAVQDIYDILEEHNNALITTGLDVFCITFDTNANGDITQREINLGVIQTLCDLKTVVEGLDGTGSIDMSKIDISKCSLDLTDFLDACGESISDFCELIQALIDSAVSQQATIDSLNATVASHTSTIASLDARITALEALHP